MKVSFIAFLVLLFHSYAQANDDTFEFDTKMDIVACFPKKGCTAVDGKKTTQKVVLKKMKGKEDRFHASLMVSGSGHGEKYQAFVEVLKARVKENWIYTFTAYFKGNAKNASIIQTRNARDVSVMVIKAPSREKNKKKKVNSTFYFGPARTDIF